MDDLAADPVLFLLLCAAIGLCIELFLVMRRFVRREREQARSRRQAWQRLYRRWVRARRAHRTRARNPGIRTPETRCKLFLHDGGNCGVRSQNLPFPFTGEDVQIDYIRSLSWGGTNHLASLQLAHAECNLRKGNRVSG